MIGSSADGRVARPASSGDRTAARSGVVARAAGGHGRPGRRSSSSSARRAGEHEVDQVPDLLGVDRRVVRRHLGPVDPLGDPPVDVERPPAPLVDASVQVVGPERVAPVVELLPELRILSS